jgi:hypothetical protein
VHGLRHSFVAIALANGVTLPEAAMLARQANPRVTLTVYAGLTDDEVRGESMSARRTRYRLGMVQRGEASSGHAISRLADSGEDAMRNLVALPLRMLAGALGIFEALLRTAADAVSEVDPIDQRVLDLEQRIDSLEKQGTGRGESAGTTSAARKMGPRGSDTAAEDRGV